MASLSTVSRKIGGRLLFGAKKSLHQIDSRCPTMATSLSRFSTPTPQNYIRQRRHFSAPPKRKDAAAEEEGSMHFVKAGLPMILFCGLGVWVVSNGIEGKNRERDAFQGRMSK